MGDSIRLVWTNKTTPLVSTAKPEMKCNIYVLNAIYYWAPPFGI